MAKIQKCMGICKMGEDNCIIIYEKRELWGKTDLLVKQLTHILISISQEIM